MPLAVFSQADGPRKLGKVIGDRVIDLSIAAPGMPGDIIGFLGAGDSALAAYRAVETDAPGGLPLSAVRLHAPVPAPEKFLAIGMNYSDHGAEAKELGLDVPVWQVWFNKQVSCINGPFDDVVAPKVSEKLDYEAELAVVIGKTCRYITPEEAPAVVGGYMVANDVSARDWQLRTGTMTLGKSFDTHGPIGPWLTLAEDVADPHALDIRMLVNGEERQHANTSQLIHDIWQQISYLSQVMTLKPGDILATGTPAGVGVARKPPVFLQPGDVMRVEIAGLGHIENRVVADL